MVGDLVHRVGIARFGVVWLERASDDRRVLGLMSVDDVALVLLDDGSMACVLWHDRVGWIRTVALKVI